MKIVAITTIRSDYDLNSNLYSLLDADPEIDLRLLVSGAHLSHEFGKTADFIENDGFKILLKTESLLASDSKQSRIKSASLMLNSWIDAIATYNPDLILYSGDREDVMVASMISAYLEIPSVHIFSGDHVQDGHVDNPVRHATSKLSSVFFVSTEKHKQRLIRIGESPERIFNIGSMSLDKFFEHKILPLSVVKQKMGVPGDILNYALVIYHPITKEIDIAPDVVQDIINSLIENDIYPIISFPNSDPGNSAVINMLKKYEQQNKILLYKSLNRDVFLNLYKNAKMIIGNSSSGIIESGSIPIPAINVGLRQFGRDAGKNVIFCKATKKDIKQSISKALSAEFKNEIHGMSNLYGDGKSSKRAYELIKSLDFKKFLFKTEDPLDS